MSSMQELKILYPDNKTMKIICNSETIREFVIKQKDTSGIHGLKHWENVERNGVILAQSTGANVLLSPEGATFTPQGFSKRKYE